MYYLIKIIIKDQIKNVNCKFCSLLTRVLIIIINSFISIIKIIVTDNKKLTIEISTGYLSMSLILLLVLKVFDKQIHFRIRIVQCCTTVR